MMNPDEASLPVRITAYTPLLPAREDERRAGMCAASSAGTKFDKVEMYTFCKPEESDLILEQMRADAEATSLAWVSPIESSSCARVTSVSARP